MIYFIADPDNFIKIGKSNDPIGRLKTLQTGNAGKLRLLAVIPGDVDVEGELHRRFAEFSKLGEWFNPDTRLLGFIEGLVYAQDTRTMWSEMANYAAMCGTEAQLALDVTYGAAECPYLGDMPPAIEVDVDFDDCASDVSKGEAEVDLADDPGEDDDSGAEAEVDDGSHGAESAHSIMARVWADLEQIRDASPDPGAP